MSIITLTHPEIARHNAHHLRTFQDSCNQQNAAAVLVLAMCPDQSPTIVTVPGVQPAELATILEHCSRELRAAAAAGLKEPGTWL